ncbi:MAG TPA: ATP12 family protein [Roseiarcus sp.]|nr:ATP12 family protein [Roseiarcus sp.]
MSEAPVDPVRAARAHMRQAAVKRFYRAVEVREVEGGRHALTLDGRGARTPGRNALSATSRALMTRVAAEWERQRETIDPADMPLTRLLNSAIDGVARTMAETRAEILRYAGSDLLCYRAEAPETLAGRQAEAFDPTLRWAAERLGARLTVAAGVVHVDQPPESIEALRRALEAFDDPAALAGLSAMTNLTGSALLALATALGFLEPQEAWRAAHVDEDFQNEFWGVDEEARVRREARWREMEAAAIALAATRTGVAAPAR